MYVVRCYNWRSRAVAVRFSCLEVEGHLCSQNGGAAATLWTNPMRLFPGINVVKRKLAAHDNLKITIEQTGDKFHVKESSNFRTLEVDFTLGVTFDYSLADGTEVSVSKQGPQWVTVPLMMPFSARPARSNDANVEIKKKSLNVAGTFVPSMKCNSALSTRPARPWRGQTLPLLQRPWPHRHLADSPHVSLQGSWTQEGDMLKGIFTRKDNGKKLTTTRVIEGGELVQVSRARKVCPSVRPSFINAALFPIRPTTTKEWMQRGSSRRNRLTPEWNALLPQTVHLLERSNVHLFWNVCMEGFWYNNKVIL